MTLTPEEFEDAVSDALDSIPPALTQMMDNVVILVEDDPPPEDPNLLGLYEGVPLTERDTGWAGVCRASFQIFRNLLRPLSGIGERLGNKLPIRSANELPNYFGFES